MIKQMRSARKSPAVLKMSLILLRGQLPEVAIFAFEGSDDKLVYRNWIARLTPDIAYEPFPCGGKKQVLELRNVISRDLGSLGENVFFFIDRDFDDLNGFAADQSTFVTDTYSVENHLVSASVLDSLLTNEFHCHGRPDVRLQILETFTNNYEQFLQVSKELNRRLFIAKRIGLQVGNPTDKIADIALIDLVSSSQGSKTPELCFVYHAAPDAELAATLSEEFERLDPATRYRGKYALAFFMKWLQLLAEDYTAQVPLFFGQLERKEKIRWNEVSLGTLASRSNFPSGLGDFLLSLRPVI